MSPTGNGSSKPQTWSARIMGAFTGPADCEGIRGESGSRRNHPARGAQGGDVHPEPAGGQMVPGGACGGHRCRHRHPCVLHRGRTRSPRPGRTPSPSLPTPNCSEASSWCSAPSGSYPCGRKAHPRHVRLLPDRLRLHDLPRPDRIRLHPPRWLAHAAGLAHQQIRHHEYQGDRPGGRGAAHGDENGRTPPRSTSKATVEPGRPEAADRQQALHAEGAASEEDPEADRVDRESSRRQRASGRPRGVSRRARSGAPTAAAGVRRSGGAPASEPSAPPPAPAAPRLP